MVPRRGCKTAEAAHEIEVTAFWTTTALPGYARPVLHELPIHPPRMAPPPAVGLGMGCLAGVALRRADSSLAPVDCPGVANGGGRGPRACPGWPSMAQAR